MVLNHWLFCDFVSFTHLICLVCCCHCFIFIFTYIHLLVNFVCGLMAYSVKIVCIAYLHVLSVWRVNSIDANFHTDGILGVCEQFGNQKSLSNLHASKQVLFWLFKNSFLLTIFYARFVFNLQICQLNFFLWISTNQNI